MTIDTTYGRSGVTSGEAIWTGGVDTSGNGQGESYRFVSGAAKAMVGEYLCSSGGFSANDALLR
jgi:hypothetical protein